MRDPASNEPRWDTRIARARTLAAIRPAAAEALTFYAAVAEYQKSLVGADPEEPRTPGSEVRPRPLVETLDLGAVLAAIPNFLAWLPRVAPARLAESATGLRRFERDQWRHLVHSYLADDGRDIEEADRALRFVVEAVLQPFVEQAAIAEPARQLPTPDVRGPIRCPFCHGLPVVGVLREEGHGAKRTLVCGLCLTERPYLRIVCPSCDEQQFDALPVYTADQLEYVRIEACDRCRSYLKTIDLTKDGLAVPVVDDIASVSMDLWARDRGYVRLRANLLGL
jgi:FdhE protein